MKAKVNAGVVLENDITRYEVQLQNLLYKKTELQGQVSVYNSHLVVALGLPEGTEIVPDSSMLNLECKRYTESELQSMATLNSPSLERSQLMIGLGQKRQKIARAGYMPKLSLVAADELSGPITYEIPTLNNNINIWYVGMRLSYDIGSLYKTPKETAREKQAVCLTKEQYAATQEQVTMNIKESYTDYENAFVLLHTQEKSLQLATENRNVIFKQYLNGLVLIIDLLDADDLKLSAEIQETNARINITYNYYKLLYVTGTL
jgi:outer membrane protein TolC